MQTKLKTSDGGLSLIKSEESFVPKPYNDPTGNATIAWGHLLHMGAVTPADWAKYGKGITEDQGTVLLQGDVAIAENEVNTHVQTQLNQNQFDAIVDFVYNDGVGTFEKSSVLKFLNADDFDQACDYMLKYDHSGGEILPGLLARRQKEVTLFNTPVAD